MECFSNNLLYFKLKPSKNVQLISLMLIDSDKSYKPEYDLLCEK